MITYTFPKGCKQCALNIEREDDDYCGHPAAPSQMRTRAVAEGAALNCPLRLGSFVITLNEEVPDDAG